MAQLGLDVFWREHLGAERGLVPWEKVLELLAVNRLLDPRSELYVHEKWFPQTAMDVLLDSDFAVAEKDRLYRCLDHLVEHKEALEKHLAARWHDLFNASFDMVLYDLTSTYFEGSAGSIPKAQRGYSRDHRPDCKQLVIALIVTPEGFPLTYEVFSGNTVDVTTLKTIVEQVETKHGAARRVWVFDRGITSEENLAWLRERGTCYLVGTPKHQLSDFAQHLTDKDWTPPARSRGQTLSRRRGHLRALPQCGPCQKRTRHALPCAARLCARPHQAKATVAAGRLKDRHHPAASGLVRGTAPPMSVI